MTKSAQNAYSFDVLMRDNWRNCRCLVAKLYSHNIKYNIKNLLHEVKTSVTPKNLYSSDTLVKKSKRKMSCSHWIFETSNREAIERKNSTSFEYSAASTVNEVTEKPFLTRNNSWYGDKKWTWRSYKSKITKMNLFETFPKKSTKWIVLPSEEDANVIIMS